MLVLDQIRIWLKQPNVWRFLSFVSTVIGLVCYARSSPFNHLFKKWNFLKKIFYTVVSFIICLIVLFAKVWQSLRSHLVKAHLTVMIFTGSSVYSFFFEKALKGKPDAYSLVSCAAFAIMSLSLSRQTHCGFEVDLLHFFLGCLFVLLAKIHLLLAIFGGGAFAYCLAMLRYFLDKQPPQVGDLEQGLADGDSQQANIGSPLHTTPQQANTDSASLMIFVAPPENGHLEPQDHGVTQVDSHSQPANTGSPLLRVLDQLGGLMEEFKFLVLVQYDMLPMNEDIATRKRLAEAIWGIFMKLKKLIGRDTMWEAVPDGGIHPIIRKLMNCLHDILLFGHDLEEYPADRERTSVPDGGIHPIIRKVINCLRYILRYRVFEEYPADRERTSSSLSNQMDSIIELLESKLEATSSSYTDPALGYVFMMNNGSYIQQMAKFVGDKWDQKYTAIVQQNLRRYRGSSWDKVLDFLKLDNNESVAPNVAAESMKEKFNLFNMHFQEICSVQSTWCVCDQQLSEEIRKSVERAYGIFLRRSMDVFGKHVFDHIKCGMDDIAHGLNGLFGGSN